MSRAGEIERRFRAIQRALEELYGRQRSFGAATAAWLMAIQHMSRLSLRKVLRDCSKDPNDAKAVKAIDSLDTEMRDVLMSFHQELCTHLNIDQAEAIGLSKSFHAVIYDVCKGDSK
jgi:hypothetical protein